jgi:hypothetical protein
MWAEGKRQGMSTQAANQNPDSIHLKNVFEQSLAVLGETKADASKNKHSARLRGSALPLHVDPALLEKRALDDAAKALATLWNVSSAGPARLQRHYHR